MSDLEHGSTVGGSVILTQTNLPFHTHTAEQVSGLGNAAYCNRSDSTSLDDSNTIATSRAVNSLRGSINNISLSWGGVQITGYVNSWDTPVDWTAPEHHVMCGEISEHWNSVEDRIFRFRYRWIGLAK